MPNTDKKIALLLMVKNEAHIIERCISFAKPIIDKVILCDTGSKDNTIIKALQLCQELNLPIKVYSHEWRDFGTNRTMALEACRREEDIDYALMIDADEILVFTKELDKASLDKDFYNIMTVFGNTEYFRPQMTSNKIDFKYRAVVHEFLETEGRTSGVITSFYNKPMQDSFRNMGDKINSDIEILRRALDFERDPALISRYHFYLAQSYYDTGRIPQSIFHYNQRLQYEFWVEEKYIACLRIGKMMISQKSPIKEIESYFNMAKSFSPNRSEASYELGLMYEKEGNKDKAIQNYIEAAMKKTFSGLFVDNSTIEKAKLKLSSVYGINNIQTFLKPLKGRKNTVLP